MSFLRIDLSPPRYVHVPQAPRIEHRTILARGADNPWHMSGVLGVDADGRAVGLSNHTWSHLDAPYHILAGGATIDRIDPLRYLALRARVVDLATASAPERRETIDGVDYHSIIDVDDLPADDRGHDAWLFVTGFGALIERGYPMEEGADWHYPSLTRAAAERAAAVPGLRVVAADSPTFDKPDAGAIAHRTLLGREPHPVLLLETLTCERLRRACRPLPPEVLLTVEPIRAFGREADGALASVFAWAPGSTSPAAWDAFVSAFTGAALVSR